MPALSRWPNGSCASAPLVCTPRARSHSPTPTCAHSPCSPAFVRAPWYLFVPVCGISGWSALVRSYVRARWRSFVLFGTRSCSPVLIRDGQPSFVVFRAGLPSSMLVCAYARPPSCWAPGSCPLVCVGSNTYCKSTVSFLILIWCLPFCVWG